MLRTLTIAVLLCLVGCQPDPPTAPETIWNVGATHLARDLPTAQSYTGRLVRVRLPKHAYSVTEKNVMYPGTVPRTLPIIIFQCREEPPTGTIVITGRCLAPVRDGIWRTVNADFSITVVDCSVIQLPEP